MYKWLAAAIVTLALLAVSVTGYSQSTPASAQPSQNRIESVMLHSQVTTPPRTSSERVLSATWTAPQNITLIGLQLGVSIVPFGAFSLADGNISGETTISRSATDRAQTIGQVFVDSQVWTRTIEIGGWIGTLSEVEVVMFPAGQGIEINAGAAVYMFGAIDGYGISAGQPRVLNYAILYYVYR